MVCDSSHFPSSCIMITEKRQYPTCIETRNNLLYFSISSLILILKVGTKYEFPKKDIVAAYNSSSPPH
jgi:hypothetical protein